MNKVLKNKKAYLERLKDAERDCPKQIEQVVWLDACGIYRENYTPEDNLLGILQFTVGYVLKETDDFLVMCGEFGENRHFREGGEIPKCLILRRRILK